MSKEIKTFEKAVEAYPDLKKLPSKLAILAYRFREELIKEYAMKNMLVVADARCDSQLSSNFANFPNIPSDLPSINFERDCILCRQYRFVIPICPTCWQLIRKCLKLKGKSHREGWDGWGYEMNLDLSNIVKNLKGDEEGRRLLKEAIRKEKHVTTINQAYELGLKRGRVKNRKRLGESIQADLYFSEIAGPGDK